MTQVVSVEAREQLTNNLQFLHFITTLRKKRFLKLYNILSYNSTELSYSWGEINNGENVHKRK
jgi:hypothetical protein